MKVNNKSILNVSILFFLIYLTSSMFLLNSRAYFVIDDPAGNSDTVSWTHDGSYYHTVEEYADYSSSTSFDNLVWFSKVIGSGIDSTSGTWDDSLRLHLIVQAALNDDNPDYYSRTLFSQKYWSYYIDEIDVRLKIVYTEGGASQIMNPDNIVIYTNDMFQTDSASNIVNDEMRTAVEGMAWLFNKVKEGFGDAVVTILDSTASGNWPAGWSDGKSGDYYQWNLNHGWGAGQTACGVHIIVNPMWFALLGKYQIFVDVSVTGKIIGGQTALWTYTRINSENVFSTHVSYNFFVTCTGL